tara:strand:- start:30204 stop:31427 length:1224 start_codon:yes stop_codon:yes gene_type:complete
MSDLTTLEIFLHDQRIGTLTRLPNEKVLLAWSRDYLINENRNTLSLSFKDQMGDLISDFKPVGPALPPYFSNMLPEGRLRDYLAARANVKSEREFFLLWALGKDLPGAIDVRPAEGEPSPMWRDAVVPQIPDPDGPLRFSLAGVQLKFSALSAARGGLTIPAQGMGGDWIVKLPSLEFEGVSENEFSMMMLAGWLGMQVPEVRLIETREIENLPNGLPNFRGQAYAIMRYDRKPDGQKLHQEDFAQIFGLRPSRKYDLASYRRIAHVLAIEGDDDDIREFVRRLVFNTLIGNADMHSKNWSVIYPDRRNASIAPAYDFVSTIEYLPEDKLALKVSRSARFDEFNLDELAHMAAKALLPEKLVLDVARETVQRFHEVWHAEKMHLPMMADVREGIDRHLARVPIFHEV